MWPPDLKTAMGIEGNPLVPCDCGRSVNADMMRDVRPVQSVLKTTADFLCDSCMEHFYRTGILAPEDYCAALGAPKAVTAKVAARTVAIRARITAIRATWNV